MNPHRTVALQSAALAMCAGIAAAMLQQFRPLTLLILICLLLMGLGLCGHYARLLSRPQAWARSPWRISGDRLMIAELLLPLLVVGLVWLLDLQTPTFVGALEVGTAVGMLGLMFVCIVGSSAWDWWYVLPRRDGVVRPPPCQSSGDPTWRNVTETWLRHRLVAEVAFCLFFILTPLIVTIEIYLTASTDYRWFARIVGPLVTILGWIVGFSKLRVPVGMWGVTDGPTFAIGDTINWRTPRIDPWSGEKGFSFAIPWWRVAVSLDRKRANERESFALEGADEYIFDVSLERATMFHVQEPRVGTYCRKYVAPMRALVSDTAEIDLRHISHCALAEECLKLHERCARILANPEGQSNI